MIYVDWLCCVTLSIIVSYSSRQRENWASISIKIKKLCDMNVLRQDSNPDRMTGEHAHRYTMKT